MGYASEGSEAEYLESQSDDGAADDMRREAQEHFYKSLDGMEALYNDATRAETGATIRCPSCRKLFVKKTYHKTFCSNAKTRGKNNCKDKYWNLVPDDRRNRAQYYAK